MTQPPEGAKDCPWHGQRWEGSDNKPHSLPRVDQPVGALKANPPAPTFVERARKDQECLGQPRFPQSRHVPICQTRLRKGNQRTAVSPGTD